MQLSDLKVIEKSASLCKESKVYQTREQNNWTILGQHDFHFLKPPGVQKKEKGMDGCLLHLHLWHLALSPLVVASLLTPPFDVASAQNLLAGFLAREGAISPWWLQRGQHTHCQMEEGRIFSLLSHCPRWPSLGAPLWSITSPPVMPSCCCRAVQVKTWGAASRIPGRGFRVAQW